LRDFGAAGLVCAWCLPVAAFALAEVSLPWYWFSSFIHLCISVPWPAGQSSLLYLDLVCVCVEIFFLHSEDSCSCLWYFAFQSQHPWVRSGVTSVLLLPSSLCVFLECIHPVRFIRSTPVLFDCRTGIAVGCHSSWSLAAAGASSGQH
jgi:hypothetical protein